MNEWIFAPEVWMMIGVGLFLLECCFDTFYLGGAAAGAALTAVGLLVLQRGAEADPVYDGLPFMIWGLATLASCALLRLVCRGSGDDPPDVNQRRYRGEE